MSQGLKPRVLIMLGCLALAACTKPEAKHALDTIGTETSASYKKFRNFFDLGHNPPKAVDTKDAQPRYCYHTYGDIICYSQPLPGEEYRLVAFQTASGGTGYAVPPAVMPMSRQAVAHAAVSPLPPIALPPLPPIKPKDAAGKTSVQPVVPATITGTDGKAVNADPANAVVTDASQSKAAATPNPAIAGGREKKADEKPANPPVAHEEKKKLKEIIFDSSELEPKTLVPEKPQ